MEFQCKICAGSLTIDHKTRIATCDYCGTKQVIPIFGEDSSKILFERGNQYLQHNDCGKAEAIFSQLLSVSPSDGEIYWDIVLCKYGVTYTRDPKTGNYIPTCNRTLTDSILTDGYFVSGAASCAGCARATGLCLNMLGLSYEHVNENKWSHQWCRVNIDGVYWICDAYGYYCRPEPSPYKHPYD